MVKHIDYKRPNLIIIIYYDISLQDLLHLEHLDDSLNPGSLKKKCRIYNSIHDVLHQDWYLKGVELFPHEDLRLPGYMEFSDRQNSPLFITQNSGS